MGRSNSFRYSFWRNVRLGSVIMGMNRADAYYEPEDDDMDSDELQYEVNELMKDEFNPCKWGSFQ